MNQAAGVVAFTGVFFTCALAIRVSFWRWIAVIYLLFASEIVLGMRHILRSPIVDLMQAGGIYQERGTIQLALLASLLFVTAFGVGRYWRGRKREKAPLNIRYCLALVATSLLFLLFLIELVSLHSMDALLYRSFGYLMAIAWLWIGLSTMVVIAALPDARLSMLFHIGKATGKEPV